MAVRDTTVTLTIEMVGVGIALSAGFVHLLEAWPAPWVPLVWMSAVMVFFTAYRVGSFVKAKFFPAPEPVEDDQQQASPSGQRRSMPSLKWSAVEPNTPTESSRSGSAAAQAPDKIQIPAADGAVGDSELATIGLPQVALGEGSEDPTAFLDAAELREETDDDVSAPDVSLPAFAESTMSLDERELALHTMKMQAVGEGAPPASDADADGPTEPMEAVDDVAISDDRTEAIDPAAIGQVPQDEDAAEATQRMDSVDEAGESPSTEALDEAQLRERSGGEVPEASEALKDRRISSPRKPFQKKTRSPKPAEDSRDQTPSEDVDSSVSAPAEQSVQMFDAEQLRAMQEELDQQDEGEE